MRQLAFAHYVWDGDRGTFTAHSVNVVALRGSQVAEITAFLEPEVLGRFGLADEIRL